MENYIVSARKYRPSTFESVVGQRALTTTLKNAIATRKLAHAYLFCGPRGVGKTTCARIFAKTINCMNLTAEGEACNECESCVSFNEQRSYNIHELDAASNNSVDDIRQLVEQVRIPPQIGKYKVYIIDEVHMLSTSAFNAFLKTLEEPPHHAIFILATTEKHKILPTILSRCQIYDFNRIGVEDTVEHLSYVAAKEGISAEPEALNVIALKADGGMRDALSIFDQVVSFTGGNITYQGVIENLNVLDYDYYFRLTDYLLSNNVSDALLLFNDVLNKGFDGGHFITGLSGHFRDLLVSRDAVTLPLLQVGASIRERYQAQAQKCPLPFLYRAMKLCNDCDLNYRASKNKRLLVELTLIQVAQLTAEGDDAGVGRSPKQQLKPVFSQAAPTASGRPKTASGRQTTTVESSVQVVSPQSQGASPSLAKATSGRSQADTASSQIVPEQSQATVSVSAERIKPSGSQNATSAMKADALPSEKVSAAASSVEAPSKVYRTVAASSVDAGDSSVVKENRKVPRMKISTLGMSIKNPQREEPAPAAPADIRKVDSEPEEDFIFNERDLNYYWQEYAGSLPMEQVAIAKRMQVLRPVLLRNSTTFEVVVDNEIAAKDFTALIPELQTYLRGRLKNSKVVMKVRVSASTENVLPVGRVEKFQMMARKNQSLMQLKEEFGLELY
ncbi:Holliday junction ATP-dependent DNA helicase RuvB [Bacteroides pyogenes]|nr:DNA polymerase III subunit gamma/tau [Bacteroides pyogenes]MBR8719701.1 Holliday junction ATP-dependent DNA helicase RuvB [Bacteroides pyogenes]MBR8726081.1 Holliday junction ATP-dependent DNA helicase RuvB [Bacteroides pyogenes]MBR8739393.1 Holliday junction ATP-dependent DNA helicase RuvB [Bacteroides pyogenes]MBR8755254.1 Holliday junction ATP-dependent DNA helicase RuvB [Bacteroides pyogenes]MBR8786657.1 Holliday junction ATP-dependent DNA helicase RuvB [Bacteroides pyogenes]